MLLLVHRLFDKYDYDQLHEFIQAGAASVAINKEIEGEHLFIVNQIDCGFDLAAFLRDLWDYRDQAKAMFETTTDGKT